MSVESWTQTTQCVDASPSGADREDITRVSVGGRGDTRGMTRTGRLGGGVLPR